MECNDCGNEGANRDCKYARGERGCKVLGLLSTEAFNREYVQIDAELAIDMVQCVEEEQWCATLPTGDGSFIILGWYKSKTRMESAILMDEGIVRPLTFYDVDKYVDDKRIEV